jgi:hypothetical protein
LGYAATPSPTSSSTAREAEPRPTTLLNARAAKIDEAKFTRYSMDPTAANDGKWKVSRRQETAHGVRVSTRTVVRGPNGRRGSPVCVWQYDHGSEDPRMITNWLEVHRKGEE